jgi:hypothetical protein
MKKSSLQLAAAISLASLILTGIAVAESQSAPGRSLVGTWRVTLTPRNCQTGDPIAAPGAPYQGLYTFHEGGTMSERLTDTVVLPTLHGPGHGVWKRTLGWQRYSYAIAFNRYDALGTVTGTQRGRADLLLGDSGNDYTTTGTSQIFDADGNLLGTNCSTIEATRYE